MNDETQNPLIEDEKPKQTRGVKAIAKRNFFIDEDGVKRKVLAGEAITLSKELFKRFVHAEVVGPDVGEVEEDE